MIRKKKQVGAAVAAQADGEVSSRRGFFKKLMVGGATVTVAGGVVKVADSAITSEFDAQKAYLDDVTPGDKIIAEREHVLMSREEKQDMLKMFLGNYQKSRSET
jgi:hypothetical protein